MICEREECPFWAGQGCVCEFMDLERPHGCNTPYGPTCWCEQ